MRSSLILRARRATVIMAKDAPVRGHIGLWIPAVLSLLRGAASSARWRSRRARRSMSRTAFFLSSMRQGLTPQDEWIAAWLRKTGRPLCVILNKAEGNAAAYVLAADFYALGLGELHPISAAHGNGVSAMIEAALEAACQGREAQTDTEEEGEDRQ